MLCLLAYVFEDFGVIEFRFCTIFWAFVTISSLSRFLTGSFSCLEFLFVNGNGVSVTYFAAVGLLGLSLISTNISIGEPF